MTTDLGKGLIISHQLSVISYQLSVISYQLSAVSEWMTDVCLTRIARMKRIQLTISFYAVSGSVVSSQ